MNNFFKFSLLCLLLATATSCYRAPSDEDCSLIPMTNNPDYHRAKDSSCTPNTSY